MQQRPPLRPVLALVLALVAGLSPLSSASGQGDADFRRIAGSGRAETAAEVSRGEGSDGTVVIARADDFPDALAGAFLGEPVLLSGADALPQASLDAINDLASDRAVLLGGEAALGQGVVDQLEALDLPVQRLAGAGRIETAAAIATSGLVDVGTVGGQRTAIVASAGTFPDALVAGPLSAGASLPILLTGTDDVPAVTMNALAELEIERVLIVGGTAVVTPDVLGTIQNAGYDVTRLAGATRQDTAVEVANFAREMLGWTPESVVVATGADFPDALAAAPFAGERSAPLLLTGGSTASDALAGLLGCLVTDLIVVGGTAVVPDEDAQQIADAMGTDDVCVFSPRTLPTQAALRVGEVHEVVMDARADTDDPAFAQVAQVRFTVVPDTLSIAVAEPVLADEDTVTTATSGAGGGLEATVPLAADGTATLAFTSVTPGLVVVQACASGRDGVEICQEVAANFAARYAATIDDGAAVGYVSVDDGVVCAAVAGDYDGEAMDVQGPDGSIAVIPGLAGCTDEPVTIERDAVDADPASYGFFTDALNPLAVIGSDYAEWEPSSAQPFVPGPATQSGTELVANIDELNDVTALNFIDYASTGAAEGSAFSGDVLFATGRFGLKSYDISDPTAPVFLDWEEMPDFWENEDMTVDEDRRLVFLSRDPRAFGGSTDDGVAGVYIIDASDPANLRRIVFHELPAGHTASCVRSEREDGTIAPCDFLWSGGPATGTHQPEDWGGRPVFVTDVRNPERPFTYPMPLLTNQNDGGTDYAHDVQVDADGLAWVSSRGGVYGFHTFGTHTDPLTGEERVATPADPVPFAGGTLEGEDSSGGVIHNSYRPVGTEAALGADLEASGFAEGELIYATDEAFTSACTSDGLFNIVTLEGSYSGEGFVSTPEEPFRLRTVGTWSPITSGEIGPVALCSAHYFDMKDSIVAYSWYGQGTRFIDVSDPVNPIQVAFHRPLVNTSFAPRFRGDYVFVADSLRGIDVLQLTAEAAENSVTRTDIAAPTLPGVNAALLAASIAGDPISFAGQVWDADPVYGWSCWIRQ